MRSPAATGLGRGTCWRDCPAPLPQEHSFAPFDAGDDNDAFFRHFEAAIPWAELSDTPPQADEAWALGVERLGPQDAESRSTVTDAAPAEYALLLFAP